MGIRGGVERRVAGLTVKEARSFSAAVAAATLKGGKTPR
jgi:hypothetical protein